MKKRFIINTIITSVILFLIFGVYGRSIFGVNESREMKKVGFVYESDESTPYTYNFIRAQKALEDAYPGQVTVFTESNISEAHAEEAIDRLIAEGCDIIFTTSYGYQFPAKEKAFEHPEIQFCQATGDNSFTEPVPDNYHTFMGEIYQGRYLTGLVAGMKLKSLIDDGSLSPDEAKLGYVAAYQLPEVVSGYTAFYLGVKEVVPSARMMVKYTDSWSNFVAEKKAAQELIKKGAVIIGQHCDTIGPAMACEEYEGSHPVYHVGYNQSAIDVAPTTSLVSTRINWIPYVIGATTAVLEKKDIEKSMKGCHIHGNDCGAGFSKDWVQLLDLNKYIVAPGTEELLKEKEKQLAGERLKVFYGDYHGVNPEDPSDVIDLKKGFIENANRSAPEFYYILDDIEFIK